MTAVRVQHGGSGRMRRTLSCQGLVSVCDDPLHLNNKRIINLSAKIAAAYKTFCPDGKPHNREECQKQLDRIRSAVSRFAGLYANNLRMNTSGLTDDDVRMMSEAKFPLKGVYKEFTFRNCYEVLMDSEKFRAGVDVGWPKKQRLNFAGDYISSGGSPELPRRYSGVPVPFIGYSPHSPGWSKEGAKGS